MQQLTYDQEYYLKNREKKLEQARWAVKNAIKAGRLKRQSCGVCNDPKTQAHHYLGYEEKHWLDIKWLCILHHWAAH